MPSPRAPRNGVQRVGSRDEFRPVASESKFTASNGQVLFCSMHGNVNGNNIPHLSNSPKEIDLLGYLLLGCLKSPVTRNTFSSKLPELNCLQLAAPCNMILGFGRNGVL